jgi:uncharacterized protein
MRSWAPAPKTRSVLDSCRILPEIDLVNVAHPLVTHPVDVEIRGVILDPVSNTPIIILKRTDQNMFLPIWIGVYEANAIALELEGVGTPRPMTHDLLRLFVNALGGEVQGVEVSALVENTFHATILLRTVAGKQVGVDARPSDAIALALRCRVPIRVAEEVFTAANAVDFTGSAEDQEQRLREWLESLTPEQLGKYSM